MIRDTRALTGLGRVMDFSLHCEGCFGREFSIYFQPFISEVIPKLSDFLIFGQGSL